MGGGLRRSVCSAFWITSREVVAVDDLVVLLVTTALLRAGGFVGLSAELFVLKVLVE